MKTILLLFSAAVLNAASYYASPTGSTTGDGSQLAPWDIQTALNKPLSGGDSLILEPGTYQGNFSSTLNGNGTQITVTGQAGARIDGTLSLNGAWVTVSYLEFFSSNLNRSIAGNDCLYAGGPYINLIHNVIHDCGGDGVGFWSSDANGMAYGNVIFYNGYNGTDRGHGHGIYTQSNPGNTKLIQDNAVLNNFGWGLHAYTEGGAIDGISYIGNTVSMNGSLATTGLTMNLLIGGYQIANNPVMRENVGYYPTNQTGHSNAYLGYVGSGSTNALVTDNWFLGGDPLVQAGSNTGATITGNRLLSGNKKYRCPSGNTCGTPALTVLARPDLYEAGRYLVTVLNLSGTASQVTVNVSGYADGQTVYVSCAEDPLGLHRGFPVYGGKFTLPLTGWTVARPIGWQAPASTLPKFGAFIVRSSFGI